MYFQNYKNRIFGCVMLAFCCVISNPVQAQDETDTPVIETAKDQVANRPERVSEHEVIITGTVIDAETKQPIGSAEIFAEGYSSAIVSEEGTFKLKIPYSTAEIQIKAEGYQMKNVPVKGNRDLTIALISNRFSSFFESEILPAGELPGYEFPFAGSHTKKMFPVTGTSLEERLQTEIGEMRTIIRSGMPGVGGNMFVRGYNSLSGISQPLVVVDGIPYETLIERSSLFYGAYINPLTNLDPEDIENISVIKDGYALYGVKGANGVVVITTRRAKELTSRVSATASWGVNVAPKKIPMLNASDYRVFAMEQMRGARYSEQEISREPYLNDDPGLSDYAKYHNNTNWQDEVMQNGLMQNYHAHVTGGDEIALYGISLGYMDVQSTLKESYMNRFNFRFNSDINLSQRFLLSLGVMFSQTNRNLYDEGTVQRTSPYFISLIKSPLVAPYVQAANGTFLPELSDYDWWGVSNPLAIAENGIGDNAQYRLNLYGKLNYRLNNDWLFNAIFSYDRNKQKESLAIPQKGVSPVVDERTGYLLKSHAASAASGYIGLYGLISANYGKTLDYIHRINANVGLRYQSNTYRTEGGQGDNPSSIYLSNNMVNQMFLFQDDEWKWASAYIDAEYRLKDRYAAWLTLSGDGSSNAGSNEKYGIFPSLGLSWNIAGESFMSSAKAIDLLQLRASWGITGNDNSMNVLTESYFASVPFHQMYGLSLQNLKNDDLKWETTAKFNAGIDIALFNERVMFSADVYKSRTKDLITLQNLSGSSGFKAAFMNGGELENTGYELKLGVRFVDTRDFKFTTQIAFSQYKNKLTALPDGNKDILSRYSGAVILSRVGEPVGVFYGYKSQGVYATAGEAKDAGLKTYYNDTRLLNFEAGDMKFENLNGDEFIDEKDMQVIGNPNPDFFGTVAFNFTYKTVSLDAVFTGVYGNDVYNHLRAATESMSSFNNQSQTILNRWKAEGQQTNIPKAGYQDYVGNARFSDRWIEDGSYLRLKNLTLSWNISKKILFLDGFTLFATANNVFTITNYLGSDPEFSSSNHGLFQGVDAGYLPQGRSFMGGFKLNL